MPESNNQPNQESTIVNPKTKIEQLRSKFSLDSLRNFRSEIKGKIQSLENAPSVKCAISVWNKLKSFGVKKIPDQLPTIPDLVELQDQISEQDIEGYKTEIDKVNIALQNQGNTKQEVDALYAKQRELYSLINELYTRTNKVNQTEGSTEAVEYHTPKYTNIGKTGFAKINNSTPLKKFIIGLSDISPNALPNPKISPTRIKSNTGEQERLSEQFMTKNIASNILPFDRTTKVDPFEFANLKGDGGNTLKRQKLAGSAKIQSLD